VRPISAFKALMADTPSFDFIDGPECIELAFRHGARLGLIDDSGKNILHHAYVQDDSEVRYVVYVKLSISRI
jgi:hypothetical protein